MEKLQWSALEYEDKGRDKNWFWALGTIVFTSSTAAIIYGNYFFATLLILSGVMLAFLAIKKPEMVAYELNSKGFLVGTSLYSYENIKSFWVQRRTIAPEELKPMLFIKSERFFMPIILTPIENEMAGEIESFLLEKSIVQEEMKETVPEKIMEALGF